MAFFLEGDWEMKTNVFEPQITYLFGAVNVSDIKKHYMAAVEIMMQSDKLGSKDALKPRMIVHFTACYESIRAQTNLVFNAEEAASAEYNLFMAIREQKHDEDIIRVQNKLYATVIGGEAKEYTEASALRVRLFKEFRALSSVCVEINDEQRQALLLLHNKSVQLLNKQISKYHSSEMLHS